MHGVCFFLVGAKALFLPPYGWTGRGKGAKAATGKNQEQKHNRKGFTGIKPVRLLTQIHKQAIVGGVIIEGGLGLGVVLAWGVAEDLYGTWCT